MKKSTKIAMGVLSLAVCTSWSLLPSTNPIGQTLAEGVRSATYKVTEDTFKYDFLGTDEMPILGYVGMPNENAGSATNPSINPSFLTKSHFMKYKEAGFNILSGLLEREPFSTPDVHKAMEVAEETGLVYFVNDVAFRCDSHAGATEAASKEHYFQEMKDKWYLKENAFGGIAVKDEPSAQDFDAMGRVNESLKELTDGKILYTNLFPSYVSSARLYLDDTSGSTWDMYVRYVDEFLSKVKPDVLAYDYYVFMKDDSTLENTYGSSNPVDQVAGQLNLNRYFQSLSLFRQKSQEQDIPYWVTVASYNHRHHKPYTKKQTSWTVNTSLAYGAKGIQYYTYWPSVEGKDPSNWVNHGESGLVTLNGTPHDTYYNIKEINDNIKVVDDVLMKCTHKGVIQYGNTILPTPAEDTLHGYGLLGSIDGDAFVGCFDNNGKDVYYIVSNSVNAGRQTFKANFLDKVNVRLTNLDGTSTTLDTYSVGFNLSGGQAVLLEVL